MLSQKFWWGIKFFSLADWLANLQIKQSHIVKQIGGCGLHVKGGVCYHVQIFQGSFSILLVQDNLSLGDGWSPNILEEMMP